jgi:nickel/cobalt exporter
MLLAGAGLVRAHPVPRSNHDRKIVVRVMPNAVEVQYHLELDAWTVVFKDLPAVLEPEKLAKLQSPREFYEEFTRGYAPILAGNLIAFLDGRDLEFRPIKHSHQVTDSVQCDYLFRAEWKLSPGKDHRFEFQEGNYRFDAGKIEVSLTAGEQLELANRVEPDEALLKKSAIDLAPGDDHRLRRLRATIRLRPASPENVNDSTGKSGESVPPPASRERPRPEDDHGSLLDLLLDTRHGLAMLLFLSACFGAFHALTPGHGKTLVAAYLVGQRGTVWHALLLGLVTTLSHTGAVLILAAVLLAWPDAVSFQALQFISGVLVVGLGFWLLLRRLAGQPDHVHLPGHHHHHHDPGHHHHPDQGHLVDPDDYHHPGHYHDHGHHHSHGHGAADHWHDEHGHLHPLPDSEQPVTTWGLIVLGISGGIIPCTDAILLFLFAISANRVALALPMLLAFSAGLAAVLVLIGMMVVFARNWLGSQWGESRWFGMLPVGSAAIITGLGIWLCYRSIQP